ncbi:MAG TPA: hypothetical protein VJN71_04180 [Nitrososphaerales archaeon]|nr:hypothetical protein [Nitrososphaerales archaeon]
MASRTAGLGTFSEAIRGILFLNKSWCASKASNTLSYMFLASLTLDIGLSKEANIT